MRALAADGVAVGAVEPRVVPARPPDAAHGLPDGAVTLEPGPEGDLPHPVAAAHPAFGLEVGELVPDAATGGVAEAVERGAGRLQVVVPELQVLLQLVEHPLAPSVYAEVLEGELVVRDVGLGGTGDTAGVGGLGEEVAVEERGEEEELLGEREDQRAEGGDVGLQCVASHFHEVSADG